MSHLIYDMSNLKYFDNVRVNHSLNAVFFILYVSIYKLIFNQEVLPSLGYGIISVGIYAFSSAFFQPDLDQKINRPGRKSFPWGSLVKIDLFNQINKITYPVSVFWYYFWLPYGHLLTHRGISHWPIIGTYTRILYLYFWYFLFKTFLFEVENLEIFFSFFYKSDFSLFWVVFATPIFLSDIIHLLVDMADSLRKNTPFQSYAQEPGILLQMINPKIMKYHRKGLRGAKKKRRNKKK